MSLLLKLYAIFWFLFCLKRSEKKTLYLEVELRSKAWTQFCHLIGQSRNMTICYAICITDAANLHPSNVICCFTFVILFFSPVQIRPYVGCLVQYLPLLWKQSEEHNMLRCAILTTLIHLVQVCRDPCRR